MAKKPQSLNELKKIWYKKLEESGFEDLEADETRMKKSLQTIFNRKSVTEQYGGWQAKAAYYQMCDRFLLEHPFTTELEKAIWEYHTNAISFRDIAETLKKANILPASRQSVFRVVHRLETIMKARYLFGYESDEQ